MSSKRPDIAISESTRNVTFALGRWWWVQSVWARMVLTSGGSCWPGFGAAELDNLCAGGCCDLRNGIKPESVEPLGSVRERYHRLKFHMPLLLEWLP
eukprot:4226031-Amphidinium_carterae.1